MALASIAVLAVLAPGASAHAPVPPHRVAWRLDMPTPVSAPVLDGTTAVVVGRAAIVGIDIVTGDIAWTVPREGGALLRPALGYVDDGAVLVYVERADDAGTASPTPSASGAAAAKPVDLVALDLSDRSERWRVAFPDGIPGGVLAWGANAYAVDGAGRLSARSLDDGTEVWSADAVGAGDAPPVGFDDAIYVSGRDPAGPARISAFEAATGERRWSKAPTTGAPRTSGLAVADDAVAYAASDRLLHVLDRADGAERWTALLGNLSSPVSAPLVTDGAVVTVDLVGTVDAHDLATGERRWSFALNDLVVRWTPVATDTAIVVGTNAGRLVSIDPTTGHLVGDLATGAGLLGGSVVAEHAFVVTKGGADPAVLLVDTDPAAGLLDVASPTDLDPAALLGRAAAAGLAMLVLLGLVPRLVVRLRLRSPSGGGA